MNTLNNNLVNILKNLQFLRYSTVKYLYSRHFEIRTGNRFIIFLKLDLYSFGKQLKITTQTTSFTVKKILFFLKNTT